MNEHNIRNLIAGLFVIFMIFTMIFVGLSLSGNLGHQKTYTYKANFKSINGLHDSSNVSYKGFNIGKVQKIQINQEDPRLVEVIMTINQDITIYKQTKATLKSLGVTGQCDVELFLEVHENEGLQPIDRHGAKDVVEIPTEPSQLSSIINNIDSISKSLKEMAEKINSMMSSESIASADDLMKNFNKVLYNISNSSIYFNKTALSVNNILSAAEVSINKLNVILGMMEYDPSVLVTGITHDD